VFQRQTLVATGGYPLVEVSSKEEAKEEAKEQEGAFPLSKQPNASYKVLPDYWTGLLYSRLMGQKVLQATSSVSSIRIYAHCHAEGEGGVTVAWLNIGNSPVNVDFGTGLGSGERKIWTLTAGRMIPSGVNPLQSQEMLLNGKLLALEGASTLHLPPLQGKALAGTGPVELAATSYGYLTFAAGLAACS